MDTKSLAKSKRSHTQHHQLKKPRHHKPKTLTTPSTAPKSADKKQDDRVSLPSNWDRYDEEEEEELMGEERRRRRSDVVKVKSKGADFGVLVTEAKEKAKGRTGGIASFDEAMPDMYQGLGPLLAVRGENLVSWIGTDDFLDDETIPYEEPPFFSLNLHTLAERLARIDLAKRLFIEDDLFPPELIQETNNNNQVPVHATSASATSSSELPRLGSGKEEVLEDRSTSSDTIDFHSDPNSSGQSIEFEEPVSLAKGNVHMEVDHLDQIKASHVAVHREMPSSFQAAEAEAELDRLLGSFSDMNFLDPTKSSSSMAPAQSSSGFVLPSISIDDTLDDLLNESIRPMNENPSSSFPNPGPKSKVLDDFDSWLDTI